MTRPHLWKWSVSALLTCHFHGKSPAGSLREADGGRSADGAQTERRWSADGAQTERSETAALLVTSIFSGAFPRAHRARRSCLKNTPLLMQSSQRVVSLVIWTQGPP